MPTTGENAADALMAVPLWRLSVARVDESRPASAILVAVLASGALGLLMIDDGGMACSCAYIRSCASPHPGGCLHNLPKPTTREAAGR